MIETRIDKFHRDDETTEHLGDCAMRFDVGTKLVAAKKHIAAEERVTFAFEIIILGEPGDLIAAFFHPTGEVRRFARALFVAKVTRDKSVADSEPGIGGENHVRQFWLRWNEIDFAIELRQRGVQTAPLFLGYGGFGAAGPTHPGINFVLNAVVIGRTKQQLGPSRTVSHKIDNYSPPS